MGWASSTVMQWCPTWLSEELGFDIKGAGFISALPPLVGFAVATGSGLLGAHPRLQTTGRPRWAVSFGLIVAQTDKCRRVC